MVSLMRVIAAVLGVIVVASLSGCGGESAEDDDTTAFIDCVDLWKVQGQLRSPWQMAKPLRRDLVGAPLRAAAWDCETHTVDGDTTLRLRRIEGVPPRFALYAPGDSFYEGRVFVPEKWGQADSTPPPRLTRFLEHG